MDPLRILIVEAHPPTAMPVIDILVALGHRPEAHPAALPALAAVTDRRRSGRPFHLVIATFALPDLDAAAFVRQLRERGEGMPIILYGALAGIDRAALEAAQRQDARFLDLPIDRSRLEALLLETAAQRPSGGSARIRTPLPEAPDGLFAPQTRPIVNQQRTPRPAERAQPTTTRFRRSITGRTENPNLRQEAVAPQAPLGWRVLCATCRREFSVEARPQAYNIVCVHCGQVNRIEPK